MKNAKGVGDIDLVTEVQVNTQVPRSDRNEDKTFRVAKSMSNIV